jgi:alkanesulfonate monooxygenase SsuD/methylene tetrahydromethanopterin reductase-like flavin-dependent oxidoreductase (luciferase family)
MRHGIVILPQQPWADARRRWQQAEELGFDHAWTYDHLSWRSLCDEPWHATIPTLTAAAVVTSSIRLGTFVASPNFRHPVPFAKELATLDDIAGGRMLLGVGSGGTGFDAFVLGQTELTGRQRHERFVEFVSALDGLLRFEPPGSGGISFGGRGSRPTRPGWWAHPRRHPGCRSSSPRMGRRGSRWWHSGPTAG